MVDPIILSKPKSKLESVKGKADQGVSLTVLVNTFIVISLKFVIW